MKIVHLIDNLWWGGAQKVLIDFGTAAVPRGLEVLVIALRGTTETPYRLLLENTGVRVRSLSMNTLYDVSAIPQVLAILREEKADILHTHLSHAYIVGGIAGRLAGIPVVASLHNVRRTSTPNYSRLVVERAILRFMTRKLIAVGNVVADTYQAVFPPDQLRTVPYPVERSTRLSEIERNQLRKEIAGDSDQTIVLAVGRLVRQKAFPELLSAFAKVHDRHPNVILAVAGDGPLREALEEQAKSLALNGSVRFLGFRKDISSLLEACDLYVSSSHWEGLSVAMLEAMSAGVPVLATTVGEAPYLLAEGRGVCVPPRDVEAFAREFSLLLDRPEARKALGENARAYVEEYHSVNAWLNALLDIYASTTGKAA
jgi:glycosyltransferase involved in cell wall biosynthesis